MHLSDYTTTELLDELARMITADDWKPTAHLCHDCGHFVALIDKAPQNRRYMIDCPENYNPCQKGHKMSFLAPTDMDEDFGFYRHVCTDRSLIAKG